MARLVIIQGPIVTWMKAVQWSSEVVDYMVGAQGGPLHPIDCIADMQPGPSCG